ASKSGAIRLISSAGDTGLASGWLAAGPTSTTSDPTRSISIAAVTAPAGSSRRLSSKKESSVRFRMPNTVTLLRNIVAAPSHQTSTHGVTRLLLGCPRHRLYKKTVITSHENRHCAVTTAAFGQGSGPVA